tara:strand:- start:267 stop:614 length:348 start_codon:yes stop_codon:yes gene_type:complete
MIKKITIVLILIGSMSTYGQKKYSLYGTTSLVQFEQVNVTLDGYYKFSPEFSFSTWSQRTSGIEDVRGGDYFASVNTFNYSKKSSKSTLSMGISVFKNESLVRNQIIIKLRFKIL